MDDLNMCDFGETSNFDVVVNTDKNKPIYGEVIRDMTMVHFTAFFNNKDYAESIFPQREFRIARNTVSENPHQDLAVLRALFERKNINNIKTIQLDKLYYANFLVDVGSCPRTYAYDIPGYYLIPNIGTGDYMRISRQYMVTNQEHNQIVIRNDFKTFYEKCDLMGAKLNFTDSIYYITDLELMESTKYMPLGLVGFGTCHVFKREGALYFGADDSTRPLGTVNCIDGTYVMTVDGNPMDYTHANRFPQLEMANRHIIQTKNYNR